MSRPSLDHTVVWLLRAAWASLPFTAGPTLADALDGAGGSFRVVASIGLWVVWGLTLLATLVPHALTLTVHRIVAPAAVAAIVWAVVETDVSVLGAAGLTVAVAAAALAQTTSAGALFVDGSSYGDERRLPLRPPAALLLGPIPLAWAVTVAGAAVGPLLLGDQRWIAGALVTAVGLPAAAVGARSLYALARRWVVFVPAGLVLHDAMALADPQLFRRGDVELLAPALDGSGARDLSLGASGLLLELRLRVETKVALRPPRRSPPGRGEPVAVRALLFAPTQPGRVLAEASRRRIAVG